MKRVLITGKGSYIGTKVEEWLTREPKNYEVSVLDMLDDSWRSFKFEGYDCVYHVAGIAHRKDAPDELYERVNHILAVEVAKKAADEGVKQFIFMSSGAVYSQSDRKHRMIIVEENSPFAPETPYGVSKMKAEEDIRSIKCEMKLAILRPPTVYGPGAKGNYNQLAQIAKKSPIFPKINNQRSMIYIDNLCEFVKLIIDKESEGVYLPQNAEYVNTTEMVKEIADVNGHKIWITPLFNWVVWISSMFFDSINKAIGTYYYKASDYFQNDYCVVNNADSIIQTERKT